MMIPRLSYSDKKVISAIPESDRSNSLRLTALLLLLILLFVPSRGKAESEPPGSVKAKRQNQSANSSKCAELTSRLDIDLKEVVRAGCEPSAAQLSHLMDNPVGNLVFLDNEFDWIQLKGSKFEEAKDAYVYKLIPTFPMALGDSWNLINRPVFQVVSVPFKKSIGQLMGMSPNEIVQSPDLVSAIRDPFGRTTGFGDITYVGLASPKKPYKVNDGIFVWGIGPTLIFPTASAAILGQGKFQAGPTAAAAYLGKDWVVGLFPQHWWSYAGDSDRANTNLTNIQYFIYRNVTDTIKIGMCPNVTINWNADGKNRVTFPVGLGINWMTQIGILPIRLGIEAYYSVIHPEDTMGSRWSARFMITPVIPTFLF
jgi:hypothetical protein